MATEIAIRSAAKAEMLIRKPIEQVFEAFLDPAITSNFWFTRGSGRLEPEHHITWDWEMYGLSVDVTVQAVEPHERILMSGRGTTSFQPLSSGALLTETRELTSASPTKDSAAIPMPLLARCATRPKGSRWCLPAQRPISNMG